MRKHTVSWAPGVNRTCFQSEFLQSFKFQPPNSSSSPTPSARINVCGATRTPGGEPGKRKDFRPSGPEGFPVLHEPVRLRRPREVRDEPFKPPGRAPQAAPRGAARRRAAALKGRRSCLPARLMPLLLVVKTDLGLRLSNLVVLKSFSPCYGSKKNFFPLLRIVWHCTYF